MHSQRNFYAVGIDGCKDGWFYVQISPDDEFKSGVAEQLDFFFDRDCQQRILIDVPIGLPSGESERQCDKEARKLIGSRRSSVFRVPARAVLPAYNDYDKAKRLSEQETRKSISKTTWSILDKIKEVDDLVRKHGTDAIREVHPEVCFWAFNGEKELCHSKKTHNGFWKRLDILESVWSGIEKEIRSMCTNVKVAPDDVLDATVAALTATYDEDSLELLPKQPSCPDDCDLPMQIVYAKRDRARCQ